MINSATKHQFSLYDDYINFQEKRILLFIDRVLGVRIVMSEKLTSQMIREGG